MTERPKHFLAPTLHERILTRIHTGINTRTVDTNAWLSRLVAPLAVRAAVSTAYRQTLSELIEARKRSIEAFRKSIENLNDRALSNASVECEIRRSRLRMQVQNMEAEHPFLKKIRAKVEREENLTDLP